jgi:hypothetical protein
MWELVVIDSFDVDKSVRTFGDDTTISSCQTSIGASIDQSTVV